MGTAILRLQDCLRHNNNPYQSLPPKSRRNPNLNPTRTRRHRNPNPNTSPPAQFESSVKNLVMGQVKILKRGEPLNLGFRDEDLVLSSTDRLGPDPNVVQKQISGLYAGAASFLASPPPSSLPIPCFFGKKDKGNDAATCDLRRLLRCRLKQSHDNSLILTGLFGKCIECCSIRSLSDYMLNPSTYFLET